MRFMQLLDNLKNNVDRIRLQMGEDRLIFLTCVLIASLFWLLVKLSENYSVEKEIFLGFNYPGNQAMVVSPPDKINVKVEGTGWDLMYDYFLRPSAKVRFALEEDGAISLTETRLRSDINGMLINRDLRLTDFSFDAIDLRLEDKVEKMVPIELNKKITFDPLSGYKLKGDIIKNPSVVTISGPISLIAKHNSWPTDLIVESDLKATKERIVSLTKPPSEIQLSESSVKIVIPIEEYTEHSLFIPVQLKNAPDSIKILPRHIKLTCVVGLSQYQEIKEEDFLLEADFTGITMDNQRNTVRVNLREYPPFVKNVYYSPKSVVFFVIKEEQSDGSDQAEVRQVSKENQTEDLNNQLKKKNGEIE